MGFLINEGCIDLKIDYFNYSEIIIKALNLEK